MNTNKLTLELLISIYRDGIFSFLEKMPPPMDNTKIIIVHQIDNDDNYKALVDKAIFQRYDIIYITSLTKGVAKSRNIAISHARADIILFCDDDILYSNDLYQKIMTSYEIYPFTSFITFKYSSRHPKNFPAQHRAHNLRTILSIGTIEISCRRDFIITNNIWFPEDMGAGVKLFLCDEPVFLSRIIKNKGTGIFMPKIICEHDDVSSGNIFNHLNAFRSRLLCFNRIFGKIPGIFLYNIYLLKNFKKFDGFKSLFNGFIKVYGK